MSVRATAGALFLPTTFLFLAPGDAARVLRVSRNSPSAEAVWRGLLQRDFPLAAAICRIEGTSCKQGYRDVLDESVPADEWERIGREIHGNTRLSELQRLKDSRPYFLRCIAAGRTLFLLQEGPCGPTTVSLAAQASSRWPEMLDKVLLRMRESCVQPEVLERILDGRFGKLTLQQKLDMCEAAKLDVPLLSLYRGIAFQRAFCYDEACLHLHQALRHPGTFFRAGMWLLQLHMDRCHWSEVHRLVDSIAPCLLSPSLPSAGLPSGDAFRALRACSLSHFVGPTRARSCLAAGHAESQP
jgi:hypothetical protein